MNENESINEMITRFTTITNDLSFLGDTFGNDQRVRRSFELFLHQLLWRNLMIRRKWNSLVSLATWRPMRWRGRRKRPAKEKKYIAFKATPTISGDDEEDEQEDDEKLSLLVKNVKRLYHKGRFNNRRGRWEGREERRGICYNCRKSGHIITNCPEMKSKPPTSKKLYKKKALKAT